MFVLIIAVHLRALKVLQVIGRSSGPVAIPKYVQKHWWKLDKNRQTDKRITRIDKHRNAETLRPFEGVSEAHAGMLAVYASSTPALKFARTVSVRVQHSLSLEFSSCRN